MFQNFLVLYHYRAMIDGRKTACFKSFSFYTIWFPGSEGSSASAEEGNTFSGAGKIQVTGRQLTLSQIIALLIKRFHHVRRSKKGFICEVRGICF